MLAEAGTGFMVSLVPGARDQGHLASQQDSESAKKLVLDAMCGLGYFSPYTGKEVDPADEE